jgi:gliding motility-associated-like protein
MTDTICSGQPLSVTPTNTGSNVVPSATRYTWTVVANPNVTGTSGQTAPQTSISQATLTNTSNTAQNVVYNVTPRLGSGANSCDGDPFTLTVTVNPKPVISTKSDIICSGGTFTIAPTDGANGDIVPAGTKYTWSVATNADVTGQSNQSIAQADISQTLTNKSSSVQTVTYTVTPLLETASGNCDGATFTVTITVNPKPAVTTPQTSAICSGQQFTVTPADGSGNIVPAGTEYTWTVTPNANITGASNETTPRASISQTLTNTGSAIETVDYTVTPYFGTAPNRCTGDPFTVTVTVNPKPSITAQNETICSGTAFTVAPTDGGSNIVPSGTTYTWTVAANTNVTGQSDQTTAQSNISQTLTNKTNTAQIVVYTVTPHSGNCTGNSFTLTVTINPKPDIKAKSATICSNSDFTITLTNGGADNDIVPTGTTYTWTVANTNTNVTGQQPGGPSATISNGQALVSSSNLEQTVIYTVTPLFGTSPNECNGAPFTLTVTVSPKPEIAAKTAEICSGETFTVTPANGGSDVVPTGTAYTWTVVAGSNISGATNQTTAQSSISQTLTNTGNAVETVTYTVTPLLGTPPNTCNGVPFTVTVTVNPKPLVTAKAATICSDGTFTVAPSNGSGNIVPAGTTYTWTVAANANVSGQSNEATAQDEISQTLINKGSSVETVTYTVTPKSGDCTGGTFTVTVTVNPKPAVTTLQEATICSGATFTVTPADGSGNIVPTGTTYTWTVAANADVTGQSDQATAQANISQTLTNTSNAVQTVIYTVTSQAGTAPICTGDEFTVTVTVNPEPTVNALTGQTVCNDVTTTAVNFTSDIASGVTYSWTNSDPTIGLGASGTGNIPAFTAKNATNAPITATITVTPAFGGCSGTSTSFNFIIDPTPTVTKPANQTVCNDALTTAVIFTGNIAGGVTYSWTNDNIAIGLPATGTGNIAPFTATNLAAAPATATITVTPTFNGCTGTPVSFTISVTPTPTVSVTDGSNCGSGTVVLTATPSKGDVNWYATQTSTTVIHTGQSYTTPEISVSTTYWVEAVDNSCKSIRTKVEAFINPKPTIDFDYSKSNQTICEGELVDISFKNSNSTIISFVWDNDATIINENSDGSITVRPPYKKSGSSYQSTHTYTVTLDNGCKQSFTAEIKVDEALSGAVTATLPQICEGISTTINAGSYNAYTYNWTSTALDDLKPESRFTVSPVETTIYTVVMTRGECKETDGTTIDVNSKPVILTIDSIGTRDREIIPLTGTGTSPFKFGVDEAPANDDPVKYDLLFGLHSFYIIDAAGCRSDAIDWLVEAPKLFIPPYFSPNGDGVMDRWDIPGMNEIYPNAVITIYDRFGKELIKYSGAAEGWDGKYLGRDMPTTDYWYIIDIEEINKQYVGHFTLLRK